MKKYIVMLSAYIPLDDVERIINWKDQGWIGVENDTYHSLMLKVEKGIVVEVPGEETIKMYADAIDEMGHDIIVEWYEEIKE